MRNAYLCFCMMISLAACEPVLPSGVPGSDIAELAAVQKLELRAVAAHVPQCRIDTQGCAKVYERTGDACLRLVQEELSQGGSASHASCAAERFSSIRNAGIAGSELRLLEALRLQRESSTTSAQAAAANARLATEASAVTAPSAGYYRATAIQWRDSFATPASCSELRRASADAKDAAAARPREGINNRDAAQALASRLTARADSKGCS